MGAFGDWAKNYYDKGFSVLPVNPESKLCSVEQWSKIFSYNFPTENDQEYYLLKYGDHDMGLATGESSGVIGIDFDYEGMADAKAIEDLVLGALPLSPCIKKGNKGWTRFYRFDGDVKNAGINRFGVRMVDVLATGRLTVLPPSNHKKEGVTYKWMGSVELLDIEDDDLPFINSKHIEQLKEISGYDNSIFKEGMLSNVSRHDRVVGFILRYSDQATDIEDLIHKTIEYDALANGNEAKGPYLNDPKYLNGKSGYEFTKELAERIIQWKSKKRSEKGIVWELGKYPKLHAQGKKASTNYEDFKTFFQFNYPDVRFDKIRRSAFTYSNQLKRWEPIDNIREIIESQAAEAGLSPSYVNRHLQRWLAELDPRLTIDIKRWHGKDVLGEMISKLKINNISEPHVEELFKEWFANIFRRLFDTEKREQNAMIILKGNQGIGKDSFINYLFSGLEHYFSEIELQDRKIENYQTVSDLLVANIPEFDETHRVSISTLKSLITSPGATFRASYARKAAYVPFYVSYISSCNFDNILRDSSGNRRFWIFNVESIKWDYTKIDKLQLLAQMYHLYKVNFKASKRAREAMKEYVMSETPDSAEELILEEIEDMLYNRMNGFNTPLRWPEIVRDVEIIARRHGWRPKTIQTLMKTKGFTTRDKKSNLYKSKREKVMNFGEYPNAPVRPGSH